MLLNPGTELQIFRRSHHPVVYSENTNQKKPLLHVATYSCFPARFSTATFIHQRFSPEAKLYPHFFSVAELKQKKFNKSNCTINQLINKPSVNAGERSVALGVISYGL